MRLPVGAGDIVFFLDFILTRESVTPTLGESFLLCNHAVRNYRKNTLQLRGLDFGPGKVLIFCIVFIIIIIFFF